MMSSRAPPIEIGDVLDGKYRILGLVGVGGMGEVYEGENVRIHRRVAIKVLNPQVAEDEDFVRRFEREAQAAGRIGSRHIVEVIDLGELPGGARYMVMEYLEGESLNERMERVGHMAPEEIVPLVVQLLDGLADAHRAGIVHRDVKPANVFLLDDGVGGDFVKILDFGVSKFLGLGAEEATATGVMLGTPRYMSPEQAKGEKTIDERADVYSVGVLLYRALAGRAPFVADSYNELLFKVVLEEAPSLRTVVHDLDRELAAIVSKAMARERAARFQSATEMAGALRTWLGGRGLDVPPPPSRRKMPSTTEGRLPVVVSGPHSWNTRMSSVATVVSPDESPSRARWWWAAGLVVAAAAALLFVNRGLWSRPETAPDAVHAAEATAAPVPEPPADIPPPEPVPAREVPADAPPSASADPAPSASTAAPPPLPRPSSRPAPRPEGPTRKYRREL